jgi:acyl-coenzyme A synthetase/AMP-(fatty) acid ligase
LSGDIEELAVVAAGEGGATRLRTCLVSRSDPAPSLLRCKQACAALLPRYMIVDEVMQFDRLPRTANGKIDRRRLAALPFSNALQRVAMTATPEVTLITD